MIYVRGPRLRVGSGAYGTTGELARKINGGGGGGGGGGGDEGRDTKWGRLLQILQF